MAFAKINLTVIYVLLLSDWLAHNLELEHLNPGMSVLTALQSDDCLLLISASSYAQDSETQDWGAADSGVSQAVDSGLDEGVQGAPGRLDHSAALGHCCADSECTGNPLAGLGHCCADSEGTGNRLAGRADDGRPAGPGHCCADSEYSGNRLAGRANDGRPAGRGGDGRLPGRANDIRPVAQCGSAATRPVP